MKLKDMMDLQQRQYIEHVLNQFDGNKSQAAQALGVDRANFHRLLKRLGLV
jgi:anaerobic nitric oxide reductase transcription regulator